MLSAYFDNNASTPVLPEVIAAMLPYFVEAAGNASSIHQRGQAAKSAVETARRQVAALLGARPAEIVFTSGGTESDNLAIFGIAAHRPGAHIITSSIEHHAVMMSVQELERCGFAVTWLPVDDSGRVDPADVRRALRPDTALISVMMANNETGILQPVEEIGRIAREAGVPFHVDAVQAAGKVPLAVQRIGCDLLSLSAHKMHGPLGVGALFVRRGTRLRPLFYGGHHERDRRAGTENLPAIVGFGEAARLAARDLERQSAWLAQLRDTFERAVTSTVPHTGVIGSATAQHGDAPPRVPNTTNIYFDFIEGESLVIALDLLGFCVSTGAACSSGATEPSHVLTAMGLPPERARSCLRFSFGKQNRDEEVRALLAVLPAAVERLRAISPAYQEKKGVGFQVSGSRSLDF